MSLHIQILPSDRIDRTKWDNSVSNASNGLIYSYSFYLDHVCDHWHGIVVDDYNAVMAIPWRRKFGIRYIYQPPFIQQLGLVNDILSPSYLSQIIKAVQQFSHFGDLLLNYGNISIAREIVAERKTNLVLPLSRDYGAIQSGYKKDLHANLRKAEKYDLKVSKQDNIEAAVALYEYLYQSRLPNLSKKDYSSIGKLSRDLMAKGMCFTRAIEDGKGAILAVGLFFHDDRRIYNVMNSTTDEGRSKEANHYLLDAVIREFADQPMLFDFEGSDLNGVKAFYEKFGAVDQPYFYYHYNNLPGIIKLFKR